MLKSKKEKTLTIAVPERLSWYEEDPTHMVAVQSSAPHRLLAPKRPANQLGVLPGRTSVTAPWA